MQSIEEIRRVAGVVRERLKTGEAFERNACPFPTIAGELKEAAVPGGDRRRIPSDKVEVVPLGLWGWSTFERSVPFSFSRQPATSPFSRLQNGGPQIWPSWMARQPLSLHSFALLYPPAWTNSRKSPLLTLRDAISAVLTSIRVGGNSLSHPKGPVFGSAPSWTTPASIWTHDAGGRVPAPLVRASAGFRLRS